MRAYIIGNGPSLANTNLDLIKGKTCFACNNIHLIYKHTEWRPTHYVRVESGDLVRNKAWLTSVQAHLEIGIPCYLPGFFDEVANTYPNYHRLYTCHHLQNFDNPLIRDEWHLPLLCQFGGSLIVAMQIALNQGFDELVLLGCDLGYKDGRPSHFDRAYEHGAEQPAYYANRNNLWAHVMGINYHARRGMPYNVINATVGGDLHLYRRERLEDIA